MTRIIVNQPEKYPFTTTLSIRYGDVNTGSHMGFDRFVSLLQEARIAFFNHYNFNELHTEGNGFVVADLGVQYKSQAFFGDRLCIEIGIEGLREKGFDILYRASHEGSGEVVALAKTAVVFFDHRLQQSAAITADILDCLADCLPASCPL